MDQRSTTGLEFCLARGQDFVSMVRCNSAGSGSWRILLLSQVEALSRALELDLIGPDDF
jgi:hypothetical protein